MHNIRILICDDHALTRTGIISTLSGEPGIFVVGEAENGADMVTQYEKLKPDLVISDIEMPDMSGIQAIKQLKSKYPLIKALFVSVYGGDEYIYSVLKAGGLGLIDKSPAKGELLYAVNEVCNGRQYFGPHYNKEQINAILKKYDVPPVCFDFTSPIQPTPTENDVLEFISQGLSTREIADKMDVNPRTIDTHRANLIKKFSLKGGHDLIRFAHVYSASKQKI
jgi:DNA-binding NarL/FixJ family response regulator